MTRGWVSIHRQISDNDLWLSEKFTRGQAWVDMILLSNHKDGFVRVRGNKITIKRGQLGWSQERLAQRWQWSRKKVSNFLNELEKEQQITQQKSLILSVVTIVNYDKFQENGTTEVTTEEQQTAQQKHTNNKDNNKNNDNNKKTKAKKSSFKIPTGIKKETWEAFEEMRNKKKKEMTDYARSRIVSELLKINRETGQDPNDVLDQSIINSYQGVFPIKNSEVKNGNYNQRQESDLERFASAMQSNRASRQAKNAEDKKSTPF